MFNNLCTMISAMWNQTEGDENCRCGKTKRFPWVEAYCHNWFNWPNWPPFCVLEHNLSPTSCPRTVKIPNEEVYVSVDESICNASTRKYNSM